MAASYHEDWRDIVMKFIILAAAILLSWAPPVAAQGDTIDLEEWPVEWGGRTRDPAMAPDGKVWFVGQAGNYVASLDPATGAQKRYDIEAGTNPHTVNVDQQRHRLVRGQPERPHRPARSGHRRDQDDHDRRGEGSAHHGVRRQGATSGSRRRDRIGSAASTSPPRKSISSRRTTRPPTRTAS